MDLPRIFRNGSLAAPGPRALPLRQINLGAAHGGAARCEVAAEPIPRDIGVGIAPHDGELIRGTTHREVAFGKIYPRVRVGGVYAIPIVAIVRYGLQQRHLPVEGYIRDFDLRILPEELRWIERFVVASHPEFYREVTFFCGAEREGDLYVSTNIFAIFMLS